MRRRRLERVFAGRNDVTAAVCFNESVLQRFMAILEKRGLKIPDDVSVVSIDNMKYAEDRGVTSVDIPKTELGVQAVRMLLERIENRRSNSLSMELNTVLIERNSVKELKK